MSQPTATTKQDKGETDSIFICSVPEILQSHVDRILLDTTPASEYRDPWSGTFMTKEVTLQLRNGTEIYIVLDDPLYLNASSRDSHDGCEKFTFRKFGKYYVFEHIYGTGNPYAAQQLSYTTDAFDEFRPIYQLNKNLAEGYIEFEKSDCMIIVTGGKGILMRLCLQNSELVIKTVLLEKQTHEGSFYEFLCDVSSETPKIINYRLKPIRPDFVESQSTVNMVEMVKACEQYKLSLTGGVTH